MGIEKSWYGITILAIAEMISAKISIITPPSSPIPSDKTKYNHMAIIIVMIALSTVGYSWRFVFNLRADFIEN